MAAPRLILPSPSLLTRPWSIQQHIRADQDTLGQIQRTTEFIALIQADPKQVNIALFTPLGQRLWLISYNGETIQESRSSFLPQSMKARYLLNDIALCFWPKRLALSTGWFLEQHHHVTLLKPSALATPVYRIERSENTTASALPVSVKLTNYRDGYRLNILTKE